MPIALFLSSPHFTAAFGSAFAGTSRVFAVGAAGFWIVHRKWIAADALTAIGQIIAMLTLPCLVFASFAAGFNPARSPGWWKLALIGFAVTCLGLLLGKLVSWRKGNEEATMLVGYQNSGYFVLPVLQALLPAEQFRHASALLFVFVMFFNASLWPVGAWILLGKRELKLSALLSPPTLATLAALVLYGIFHDQVHQFDHSLLAQIFMGGKSPGAVQLIGDTTIPLATLLLGGTVAATLLQGPGGFGSYGAAIEVSLVKLVAMPLLGYLVLRYCPWINPTADASLALLLMLEFAAPPGTSLVVFCQQHSYPVRLIPAACLVSYLLCMVTVPFWVALTPH